MASELPHVIATVERIRPLLAGKGSAVQGAVLAELTSIWVGGHFVGDDEEATRKLRRDLLAMHLQMIKKLVKLG